jgi:hypothetical protein
MIKHQHHKQNTRNAYYDISDYLPKHLRVTVRGIQLVTGQHPDAKER